MFLSNRGRVFKWEVRYAEAVVNSSSHSFLPSFDMEITERFLCGRLSGYKNTCVRAPVLK